MDNENKVEYNINLNIPMDWTGVAERVKSDATVKLVNEVLKEIRQASGYRLEEMVEKVHNHHPISNKDNIIYVMTSLIDKMVDEAVKEKMDEILDKAISEAVNRILKRKAFLNKLEELGIENGQLIQAEN